MKHRFEVWGVLVTGLVSFIAGLLIGGGVLLVLHLSHVVWTTAPRQVEAFSQVPEPQAGELAVRFRPWLLFDGGELWRPLNVSYFLDEGTHKFCTRLTKVGCVPIRNAAQFGTLAEAAGALGPATYVAIAGGKLSDYHGPERCSGRLLDCGTGPRSAIYYHVTESNDRFYVDYWWFLRFNHFSRSGPEVSCHSEIARANGVCDEHEGDWEGVTVVTPPGDDSRIAYVVYAAHKGTFRYTSAQLQLAGGTRPYVYVARGSHAAYPKPCLSGNCMQPSGLAAVGLVDLPEGTYDGKAPWARNNDSCPPNGPGSCLQSLNAQPWTEWPGQWGGGCGQACGSALLANSPRSPGLQARYQTPWCSTENGVFSCDGRALSCGDWLGPLVAAVACDPAVLSAGLRAAKTVDQTALALVIGGKRTSQQSTPGVVQALGQPFRPGTTLYVVADGPRTEILLRAVQGNVTVEDRFVDPSLKTGQTVVVNVVQGPGAPTITADGHGPIERRILEPAPTVSNR